jgi:hypothetical protein
MVGQYLTADQSGFLPHPSKSSSLSMLYTYTHADDKQSLNRPRSKEESNNFFDEPLSKHYVLMRCRTQIRYGDFPNKSKGIFLHRGIRKK